MNQSPGRTRLARLARTNHCALGVSWQWLLGSAAALVIMFAPFPACAQKTTPKIGNDMAAALRGTVSVQNGAALGGATVKLVRKAPTDDLAAAETDENGHYEFRNLEPAEYSISVEGEGFKKIEKALFLKAGDQNQDFILKIEVVSQTVEVTGSETRISTESSAAPVAVVTNTQLVTLPTSEEKVKEIIPVTPGVVRTLDSKLVFKGSDENQSLLIINSTRNTDPVTGSFGITVPTDAVDSFAVYKTPYDASL